jgi:hypothetical protein
VLKKALCRLLKKIRGEAQDSLSDQESHVDGIFRVGAPGRGNLRAQHALRQIRAGTCRRIALLEFEYDFLAQAGKTCDNDALRADNFRKIFIARRLFSSHHEIRRRVRPPDEFIRWPINGMSTSTNFTERDGLFRSHASYWTSR